jgi:hypothetical protein
MTHSPSESQNSQTALPCPRCGAVDIPMLSPGTGMHAIKATCSSCGRFLRWVSVLAPAERMARRLKNRLAAMQKLPPTVAQLAFLTSLGDTQEPPASMAEASGRINQLRREKGVA